MFFSADHIVKCFEGNRVLSDVSLSARSGEILAISGDNGSGKSTLLNILAGLVLPDTGQVLTSTEPLEAGSTKLPGCHKLTGEVRLLFQFPRLFRGLTIEENVRAGLRDPLRENMLRSILPIPAARESGARFTVQQLLKKVDLTSLSNRYPHELSFGQRKLASVVQLLAGNPSVVLLDEPFAALDGDAAMTLTSLLAENQKAGAIAILVEHDLQHIDALKTPRKFRIEAGRIMPLSERGRS